MVSVALLLISTGVKYWQYIRPLIESADRFFVPHDTFLFTDSPKDYGVFQIYQKNLGYPQTTLRRYHSFLTIRKEIERYDYIFYVDIDAIFVQPVGEEIFSNGITATRHHGFINKPCDCLETNVQSAAYLPSVTHYYCGGFNGGATGSYLAMAETVKKAIDADEANGILAKWHDESHLNRYLKDNPPAKILSSDYCYPEPELHKSNNARIVCLDKSLRGGR